MKKICTKCLLQKPLADFYKQGEESRCKKCFNEMAKLNAYPNRNAERGQMSSPARKAAQARYREKHREKIRAAQRKWVKNNLPKVLAKTNKYQAAKHNATPKWLSKEHLKQIEAIYVEASRLTKETEIPHEVDHIVPVCGKIATGLHVPWNLQILKQSDNRRKHNKY